MMWVLGVLLGMAGASSHLALTRWRARQVVEGHPARAFWTFPLILVGPGLTFLAALTLGGDQGAWAFLVGALGTSLVALALARRSRT